MKSSSLLTGTTSLRAQIHRSETEPETKTLASRVDEHRRGLRAFRWRAFRWRAGSNKSEALRKCEGKRDNGTYVPCNKTICRGEKAQGISNRSGLSSTSSPLEPDRHYARHSSILRGRRAGWGYRNSRH